MLRKDGSDNDRDDTGGGFSAGKVRLHFPASLIMRYSEDKAGKVGRTRKTCEISVYNLGCVFPALWAAPISLWALRPPVPIPTHLSACPPSSTPQAAPSLWASHLAGPWGRLLGQPARLHTLEVATGSGSRGLLVSG